MIRLVGMRIMLRLSTLLLVFVLLVPAAAHAAPGDLDPTFGSGGLVTTDFAGRSDFALSAALQPDGRIVVAGNSAPVGAFAVDFALARYNGDGTLDATFGSGGQVLSDFGSRLDAAHDVAVQPDGKIVAVGLTGAFGSDFAVARYTPDGALDPTFGSGGFVRTDFNSASDQATGVAVQPDGAIVVSGTSTSPGFNGADLAVARYAPDGTLDTNFGSGGQVVSDLGSFDLGQDLAVAPDGKLVVAGRSGSRFALVRYNADGSLDSSFGSGGVVTTAFVGEAQAFAVALGGGGKIVLVGTAANDFAVARYDASGSLDQSFDGDGTVTTDISSGSSDSAFGLALHADGSLTAAGSTSLAPGSAAWAVAHYTSNGSLDSSFGSGGVVTTTFGRPLNIAWDVLLQPDGKLAVAGGTTDFSANASDFALARYLAGPTTIHVSVDVKPESSENVIALQSNGVVPVAILTTPAFDAATVDPASVCFVEACQGRAHLEDVNLDGHVDLLLHFEIARTGIKPGDTQACLTGRTQTDTPIEGCDTITTR